MSVNASLLECIGIRLGVATEGPTAAGPAVLEFTASIADEYKSDFLLEARCIVDVVQTDAAAAKIPTCENVSGWAKVMILVCMPPIDKPAMARWG